MSHGRCMLSFSAATWRLKAQLDRGVFKKHKVNGPVRIIVPQEKADVSAAHVSGKENGNSHQHNLGQGFSVFR